MQNRTTIAVGLLTIAFAASSCSREATVAQRDRVSAPEVAAKADRAAEAQRQREHVKRFAGASARSASPKNPKVTDASGEPVSTAPSWIHGPRILALRSPQSARRARRCPSTTVELSNTTQADVS